MVLLDVKSSSVGLVAGMMLIVLYLSMTEHRWWVGESDSSKYSSSSNLPAKESNVARVEQAQQSSAPCEASERTAAAASSSVDASAVSVGGPFKVNTDVLEKVYFEKLDSCVKLVSEEKMTDATQCVSESMAQISAWPSLANVVSYFYDAPEGPEGHRFKLAACSKDPHPRCGPNEKVKTCQYAGDLIYDLKEDAGPEDICLWGNMPFSKSVAFIMAAKALGVTHVIESGRMGGISLAHYHHFGFKLTSVEFYPVAAVEETLRKHFPDIEIKNGDGVKLIPEAVQEIKQRDANARIAVIIDGPKGGLARKVAKTIAPDVAFIMVDDDHIKPDEWPGRPSFATNDPLWRAIFPIARDAKMSRGGLFFYFRDGDVATICFGDQWKP